MFEHSSPRGKNPGAGPRGPFVTLRIAAFSPGGRYGGNPRSRHRQASPTKTRAPASNRPTKLLKNPAPGFSRKRPRPTILHHPGRMSTPLPQTANPARQPLQGPPYGSRPEGRPTQEPRIMTNPRQPVKRNLRKAAIESATGRNQQRDRSARLALQGVERGRRRRKASLALQQRERLFSFEVA